MTVDHPAHLQGCHEETDTLIAFHTAIAVGNVMIRASDTDVIAIILGMLGRYLESHRETSYRRVIMDCGSSIIVDILMSVTLQLLWSQ